MATFKAYFKKEILESGRQYRYIILAVGIVLFALTGPIMLKLLPKMLESQFKGDISALFVTTRKGSLQNLVNDMFEIGNLFVVFTISGVLSDELTTQKFIFPYAKGSSPAGIVLSKALHYCIVISVFTFIGFSLNYYYTTILFKGDDVAFSYVILSASLMSLYFIFNIMLTMLFSSILKKAIISGFIVLGFSYFSTLLSKVRVLEDVIPYKLVSEAAKFSSINLTKTITVILIYCVILGALTIYRMSKIEVV